MRRLVRLWDLVMLRGKLFGDNWVRYIYIFRLVIKAYKQLSSTDQRGIQVTCSIQQRYKSVALDIPRSV